MYLFSVSIVRFYISLVRDNLTPWVVDLAEKYEINRSRKWILDDVCGAQETRKGSISGLNCT
jgi:hypothetical protein